jgi:hypothetical protein
MGLIDPGKQSTQSHLDIEDIRDNLVLLKNGKVAAIIETSSVNFDLLAEKEQDARIYTFAGLLNSIIYPIQVVIRTQRSDVSKYMALLDNYRSRIAEEKLVSQVVKYQSFVQQLTLNTNILNKRFYIVIPTVRDAEVNSTGILRSLFGQKKAVLNRQELIDKAKVELTPKVDQILKQLDGMGLQSELLKNDQLIKLFYTIL